MKKQVTFRFYEELNDFLPKNRRKVAFTHEFAGNSSIKDVIEAIGVPHVEIDLILVNGISVDFKYVPQTNDSISVYPVFETFDISDVTHLRSNSLGYTKFILDVHLGKLARYLRILGFDSLYRNDFEDNEIVKISNYEHRIILTRDIGLLKLKMVTYGYFIRSHQPQQQLNEVLDYFDLYNAIDAFSRCVKCNGDLSAISKDEILYQLKPLTRQYFDEFFRCNECGNIYWEGSHYDRIKNFVQAVTTSQRPNNK